MAQRQQSHGAQACGFSKQQNNLQVFAPTIPSDYLE